MRNIRSIRLGLNHQLDFIREILHSYLSRLLQGVPDEKKEEITHLKKIYFLQE